MHTALWCLAGVSVLGALVSWVRPKHVNATEAADLAAAVPTEEPAREAARV
jgi:hypothetical protein